MRLIGFNFKKISIEKLKNTFKDLKINTKINIEDVSIVEENFIKKDQSVVKVDFIYSVEYNPEIANIELKGQLILALPSDQSKELINGWKDKKMKEDYRIAIFNVIYKKSNVKSLELEEDMDLPLHIPFPTLKKQQK